jgi:hypothetical protein
MQLLYKQPIINSIQAAQHLKIAQKNAYPLIEEFQRLGILTEQTGQRRNRIFAFIPYIELF